ncbi:MAG: PilZ domain-containing protein [Planctomycetes bacterium]|nr:PilZ domain-containing protein [Planctomycetota bacterium]
MPEERIERRLFPRIDTNFPVTLNVDGNVFSANSINLSERGVCCETSEYFPSFTTIKVTLDLPVKNETVVRSGIIVRVKNRLPAEESQRKTYATSIYFEDIDAGERQKIMKYLLEAGNINVGLNKTIKSLLC